MMREVSLIGVDLARQVFQLHGATSDGAVVFRKKLSRRQFLTFMQKHPACRVAMEACGTAHYWARTLATFGHDVRLKFVLETYKRERHELAAVDLP